MKKVLILGHTGKMGNALMEVFDKDYLVVGKNSKDFDASKRKQIVDLIWHENPDIVINAVVYMNIDQCEQNKVLAYRINSVLPFLLAEVTAKGRMLLVHFSSDAVFDGERDNYPYTEMDGMRPVNYYGITKMQGDWVVQQYARQHYIFRLSLLFGKSNKSQFIEKMLGWAKTGEMRIADDIICSPSYSKDVAKGVKWAIENRLPYGLYHLANEGRISLFDLSKEIIKNLDLPVELEPASYKDFPHVGKKNVCTPLGSWKIDPLRPWQEAIKEYCKEL